MKFSVLILLTFVAAATSAGLPQIPKAVMNKFKKPVIKCMTENKVLPFDAIAIMEGAEFTEKINCTIACTMKELKLMNEKNALDMDKVKELAEEIKDEAEEDQYKATMKAVEECKMAVKPDSEECIAGGNIGACMFKKLSPVIVEKKKPMKEKASKNKD